MKSLREQSYKILGFLTILSAVGVSSCAGGGASAIPSTLSPGRQSISVESKASNTDPASRDRTTARYVVTELGSLGGTSCCGLFGPMAVNDLGHVDGTSNLAGDLNSHPFLWINGRMRDLGTLGGPNSSVGGMNDDGDVAVGGSDTGIPDPLGEDACGFGTFQTCLSYISHNGKRFVLPTLGGDSNDVSNINNSGLVNAFAETAVHDPTCNAPQVLGFEAFTWKQGRGIVQRLRPLAGDPDSVTFNMNEDGTTVGYSGICGNGFGDPFGAVHAVLWRNGVPIDLGNLGGTTANIALGINDDDQVVGVSALPGNGSFHAFIWRRGRMFDLGTLSGDTFSIGPWINDSGQVPVTSCDTFPPTTCRGAIWQNGTMTDLNTVITSSTSLYLISAVAINSLGQIVGGAIDETTGDVVPYLATPCGRDHSDKNACRDMTTPSIETLPRRLPLPMSVRLHTLRRW